MRRFAAAAALPACAIPVKANAQIWIGLMVGDMMAQAAAAAAERSCMMGTPMKEQEAQEPRAPSVAVMKDYWSSVKASRPANVTAHFQMSKKARWHSEGKAVDWASLKAVSDPFAAAGLVIDTEPLVFLRSGDGQSAAGQWVLRNASGKRAGTYNATFDRKAGIWRLLTLDLVAGKVYAEPLVQYCHQWGDVLPFRLRDGKSQSEWLAKRAAKGKVKADQAVAEARKAQAAAAAGKANKVEAAKLAADKAEKAVAAAALRKVEAERALAEWVQAQADAKAAQAAREAGQAALDREVAAN